MIRRTASEVLRNLEARVARLEGGRTAKASRVPAVGDILVSLNYDNLLQDFWMVMDVASAGDRVIVQKLIPKIVEGNMDHGFAIATKNPDHSWFPLDNRKVRPDRAPYGYKVEVGGGSSDARPWAGRPIEFMSDY